ncbi:MAG: PqqD family protein [Novosphingobium sp.]
MSVEAGKFFTFDDIGFEIWDAFGEARRVGDVVDQLAAKHNAPRDRVESDVITFLDRLADENLLDLA